jgi:hypothetical protein
VIVDDFYYSVDIFAPSSGGGYPEPLSPGEIESRLNAVVADAKARKNNGEVAPAVGILTGDERESWTQVS